ncbi:DUF1697 domain-containing protein [Falsihalocynthiibacter sp. S25ZX9]|uniref:DUF1697 domain-containing protein n=1 Tax=Falsihalocynthiibacter sp. S25ZX9 TaxID=3240870 RepID=UPI00350FEF65
MARWVAFLRAVNVGGHGKRAMKPLCEAMQAQGFTNATSYIQSGNLVFDHTSESANDVAAALKTLIKTQADFAPETLVLPAQILAKIHANCPFLTPDIDPKTLHFLLLAEPPTSPDLTKIETLRAPDEAFEITDHAAYLLAPSGIGRSKLMAASERLLGVPTTARNLRTIEAVLSLSRA